MNRPSFRTFPVTTQIGVLHVTILGAERVYFRTPSGDRRPAMVQRVLYDINGTARYDALLKQWGISGGELRVSRNDNGRAPTDSARERIKLVALEAIREFLAEYPGELREAERIKLTRIVRQLNNEVEFKTRELAAAEQAAANGTRALTGYLDKHPESTMGKVNPSPLTDVPEVA